ncbi:hypothetical protein GS506_15975 [Rhodococcus hoagii]|nr:hypothetical protein [Prescottella equi]
MHQSRRFNKDARIMAAVAKEVAAAPPLSESQLHRIRMLFRAGSAQQSPLEGAGA